MNNTKFRALIPFFALGFFVVCNTAAFAVSQDQIGSSSQSLPWEGPLAALAQGLTGTTAKVISIIAIFIAGIALILGEDLGQFARRLLMIVIAVAFLVGASSFIVPFTSGASIF
jgi:type IV secretory pathway VirB2 component (pilin)